MDQRIVGVLFSGLDVILKAVSACSADSRGTVVGLAMRFASVRARKKTLAGAIALAVASESRDTYFNKERFEVVDLATV